MALRKVNQVKAGERQIEFFADDTGIPEVFAEGVHGVMTSSGTVKINFYSVADSDANVERRVAVQRLVMPAAAFVEMAQLFAAQATSLLTRATPAAQPEAAPAE